MRRSSSKSLAVDLPPELLTSVFTQLAISATRNDLVNCLVCCKEWQRLAEPVLYRDIVLANSNLPIFLSQSSLSNDAHVWSLTIRLDPLSNPYEIQNDDVKRNGSPEAKRIWSELDKLAPRIKNMIGLCS